VAERTLSRRTFLAQSASVAWAMTRRNPPKHATRPRATKRRAYGGIGLWAAHNPGAHATQSASAIEVGNWWIMDSNRPGWPAYPHASIRATYKIAIEVKSDAIDDSQFQWDQSASFIPLNHCDPAWLCTKGGRPLMAYTGVDRLGNLGHPGYQRACADAALRMCKRYGVKALYIDNMHGAVSISSQGGVIPDGYADDDDWRKRAAIPWLLAVGSRLREAGIYVYANAGDRPLIGSKEYADGGDAVYRYWGQIRQAEIAAGKVALDGYFTEYFMQRPTDNFPYHAGGGTWDANAPGWQRLVARAQQLGKDFHGLTYANGGSAERYARGAFLLDADLHNRTSTLWTWSLDDPNLSIHPGAALGPRQKIGAVDMRRFENFTVYVNMTPAPQAAHGVTVPPLDTLFVPTRLPLGLSAAPG